MGKQGGWSKASQAYHRSFQAFLSQFDWDHMVTLTYRGWLSEEEAERRVKNWLRHLCQLAQAQVGYVVCLERGEGARVHFHGVLQGTRRLKKGGIARSWKHGRSQVDKFDCARNGLAYVTKDLSQPDSGLL